MIERLYNLYSKAPDNTSVTPTERFITEALVGVLESDNELKLDFLNEVCEVSFNHARITTEEFYSNGNDKNYIDIKVEGDEKILFIEVKVDSSEGNKQLERYSEILNKLKKSRHFSETHLIYLTRDYTGSPDYRPSVSFKHIFWSKVGEFFKIRKDSNTLVNSFLKLLDNLRLGPMKPIGASDLKLLEQYVDIEEKISGIKSILEYEFRKKYGKPSFSNQTLDNNRILFRRKNILVGDKFTEIGLGIYFGENPYLRIHIFINKSHNLFEAFKTKISEIQHDGEIKEYINEGISIGFKQELSKLVGDKSPNDRLTTMVNKLFKEIDKVILHTKDLNWTITP